MALDVDDLTMSIAACSADPFRCPSDEFRRTVDACARAGFRGISIWALHLDALAEQGVRTRDVARVCEDAGVQIRMVEALTIWSRGQRAEIETEARATLARAAELGAEEVLACTLDAAPLDLDASVEGFGYVCDLAAPHGLQVGLEFLPWTSIADLRTAWAVVAATGRANGGLVLDTWHWHRQPGGPDPTVLGAIAPERIHVLQLSDAAEEPSGPLAEESMQRRLLPGDGKIDLDGLLRALEVIGAEPMITPEVFNSELRALGPDVVAERVAAATWRVLTREPEEPGR